MAGPWEKYATQPSSEGTGEAAPWAKYAGPPPEPKTKPYSSPIWPVSKDDQGSVHFDSNAGILGMAKRAFDTGQGVYQGKIDPKSDEAIASMADAATVFNPVNPAIRAGDRIIPGVGMAMRKAEVPVPSADALHAAADSGYKRVRAMGVDYSSDAVKNMATHLRSELEGEGFNAATADKTFKILEILQNPPADSVVPITGLDAARRTFGKVRGNFGDPTEQNAAGRVVRGLDQWVEESGPGAAVAGPAADAGAAWAEARANYAAGKRSDQIAGIEDRAERRAAAANSGQNSGNTIRQRVAGLLEKPKDAAGYNPDELASLEEVARGNTARNGVRWLGNALGGGGGIGTMASGSIGAAAGSAFGPLGASIGAVAAPAAGFGFKTLDNVLTSRALGRADELVRKRSPLFKALQDEAPMEAISGDKRSAIIRALMAAEEAKRANQN